MEEGNEGVRRKKGKGDEKEGKREDKKRWGKGKEEEKKEKESLIVINE